MAQLRRDAAEFARRSATVLVLGPENSEAFARYWQEHDLTFVGLPDPGHTVLKLYGQEVNLFRLGRMPAMLIVDRHGRVRFVHYGHSMADIPSKAEVLGLLDRLAAET